MRVSLNLQGLDHTSAEQKAKIIGILTEVLVGANVAYLEANPSTPPLYSSGVVYNERSTWMDIPATQMARSGDCKSLVAWRMAELRLLGFRPRVHAIVVTVSGVDTFHVQVRDPSGVTEDPSRILGML